MNERFRDLDPETAEAPELALALRYEHEKAGLPKDLSPEEYARRCREIADRLGV